MTWHTMILSEPDTVHAGFTRRYYAMVDVSTSTTSQKWHWRQVDANGQLFGNLSAPFSSENSAKADALQTLNGDEWE